MCVFMYTCVSDNISAMAFKYGLTVGVYIQENFIILNMRKLRVASRQIIFNSSTWYIYFFKYVCVWCAYFDDLDLDARSQWSAKAHKKISIKQ